MVRLDEVSKVLSHALRHEPWLYELELDDEGWAPLDAVLVQGERTKLGIMVTRPGLAQCYPVREQADIRQVAALLMWQTWAHAHVLPALRQRSRSARSCSLRS